MDFWGVEVKAGKPVKVKVDGNETLHISQAALGELKNDKGNELIPLFLHANDQKFVIGTLCTGKIYNISYDLVLAKDFELSHNWKNGSIHFCGYKTFMPEDLDDSTTDSDSDSGDKFPVAIENGEPEPREEKPDPISMKANDAKSKGKIVEPSKNDNLKEDEDSEDDSEDSGSEEGSMGVTGEDSSEDDDDDSDEDDESSDEEEVTPNKAEHGKKRQAESATKTPVPEKKAKIVTPHKTGDSKKGVVHVATPYPGKKSRKAPTNDNSKQPISKSAAQVVCKSCSKTFNSDSALQSHTKAKHPGGK